MTGCADSAIASTFLATLLLVIGGFGTAREVWAQERDGGAESGTPDAGSGSSAPRPAEAPPPQPVSTVRITGTAVLPQEVARTAIGAPPKQADQVRAWGEEASRRIVDAYRTRGFVYARAWFSDTKEPRVLWFDVDEGHMRVSFVGMSSISATLFRLHVSLPGGVFQKDEVERSLIEQKKALQLVAVYYRIHELESYDMTVFGQVVPARTLEIHIVRRESFGWALDVSASAAWGVVPSVKYSASDLLWHDDRLLVDVDIAFPYRRYVFDSDPRITWVHSGVAASYRLPHFGYRTGEFLGLAFRADASLSLSQYARSDLQLTSFYLMRDVTVANLVSTWSAVEVSLGLGADLARVFLLKTASALPGEDTATPPADVYSARVLARAGAQWTVALPGSRRDRQTFANLLVDVCLPAELRATVRGQYLAVWGIHRLLLGGRAIVLAGTVPFWDDAELAGDYQRVFFRDLYWAHQAVQVAVAYHMKLWRDWFEVGVFHDLSVFEDRISSPNTLRAMDAFGPSLHFLVLDQFALNIYEGIGFAPGKFSQTLSFGVESVF